MQASTLAARFAKLDGERTGYIARAVAAASVTIPSLFPAEGHSGSGGFRTPHQSIGAKAVNTLAAKILLALLPPNQAFFRFTVNEDDIEALQGNTKGDIESALSEMERVVVRDVESKNSRPALHEAVKHLVVTGNGMLYVGEKDLKFFDLRKYVVARNGLGRATEIIVKEPINPSEVPEHMKPQVQQLVAGKEDKPLDLLTQAKLTDGQWEVVQEIGGVPDPQAYATYPEGRCPYIPLRMIRVDGESYGRGYVEEYYGDLKSLDVLSKALDEGTAAAARVIFLIASNGTTRAKTLSEAPNGGFVTGDRDDVSVLQLEKQADFQQARMRMAEIKEDLAGAFLMNASLTRNAERVTATEIRAMARELETVLGGVYALLSVELQLPLVKVCMGQLMRRGIFPELPRELLEPEVLTGVAALGRSQELDKLHLLMEHLSPLGPEVISQSIEPGEYAARVAASLSIDTDGLIPTQEERAARLKSEQAKELIQMLGPQLAQQLQQQ